MPDKGIEEAFKGTVSIGNPILGDAVFKIKKLEINVVPDGTEEDTGFNLPIKGVVVGVWVDVRVAEATGTVKTLDVGLLAGESGGDIDGFLASVSVAAVGVVKGTLLSGAQTLGALLSVDEGGTGELVPEPHVLNGTARSVVFDADDVDWVEFRGDIYIMYMDLD